MCLKLHLLQKLDFTLFDLNLECCLFARLLISKTFLCCLFAQIISCPYIRPTFHRCNECLPGFWGYLSGCKQCSCDPVGSSSKSCDQETGQCPCRKGTVDELWGHPTFFENQHRKNEHLFVIL